MDIFDFFKIKKESFDMLKRIDENLEKTIASSDEMKRFVYKSFSEAVNRADRDGVFTFKIEDFIKEYKKFTGIKVTAKLREYGGYCCAGHIPSKEELLEKCGDKKLTYSVEFNDGKIGCGMSREFDLEIKMTDALPNGKRLIDEAKIEHWTSGDGKEKRTYLKLPKVSQADIAQMTIFVSASTFWKNEDEMSPDEKAFENAVYNASLYYLSDSKHNERHGQGKE